MSSVENKRAKSFEELDVVIEEWKDQPGGILPIMQEAQRIFRCLDEEIQNYISEKTGVPVTTIYGIATFYSLFTFEPKGENTIGVCIGTACYVRGAQAVLDELEKQLKVSAGQTTADGKFTLDATRCLGCCGLAPAIMINEKVYGRLTPADVPKVLAEYK